METWRTPRLLCGRNSAMRYKEPEGWIQVSLHHTQKSISSIHIKNGAQKESRVETQIQETWHMGNKVRQVVNVTALLVTQQDRTKMEYQQFGSRWRRKNEKYR